MTRNTISLNVQCHWMKGILQNSWWKWKRICTGVILYLAFKVVFAELQLELYTSIINLSLILNICSLRKSCLIICLSILFANTCETCTLNDLFYWTFKYLSFQQQKTNSLNKSTKFSWNLDICKSTRDYVWWLKSVPTSFEINNSLSLDYWVLNSVSMWNNLSILLSHSLELKFPCKCAKSGIIKSIHHYVNSASVEGWISKQITSIY